MNFVTTLVGIAHGLIFIPVILAYFGPNVNKALLFEQQQEATKGRDWNDEIYVHGSPWSRNEGARSIGPASFFHLEKGRSETMNAVSKKDSITEMKSKNEYPSETNVKNEAFSTEL